MVNLISNEIEIDGEKGGEAFKLCLCACACARSANCFVLLAEILVYLHWCDFLFH